jgi:WD40 repeat protein
MAERVGQQFGNYRLIRLLGEGGFAEVYLGEHQLLETEAAIKILNAQMTGDDIEPFRAEARTIARLEHPNIVRVLEFGVEGKTPYLVMSYAPYGTLRRRHQKGVPLPTIVSYVNQVADALQYAHSQRVIHRDIKPENMLVGRRNEILLSDFGIALVAQSSRYQNTGDVVGTVAYMAPEQIQGKPRPASDQYALAVVVYEWLSGIRPFSGSFTEIAVQHAVAPPPPLHEKFPSISPDIEQVVFTALAKDPQQRFASVQAFARALEQASQSGNSVTFPVSGQLPTVSSQSSHHNDVTFVATPSTPLTPPPLHTPQPMADQTVAATPSNSSPVTKPPLEVTPPPPTPEPARAGIYLSRRTLLVGVGGLAVAGGASALTWLLVSRNTGNAPTPLPSTTSISGTRSTQFPTAPVGGTSSTPPPRPTATNTPTPPPTTVPSTQIGQTFMVYRGHSSYIYGLTWSSTDGSRIASASLDTSVQVWSTQTSQQYFSYNHSKAVNDVKASPDKTRIASAGEDSVVQVWNVTNGTRIFSYRGHSDAVNTVEWSPNGRYIVSASRDKTVQVWDANTGTPMYTYQGHSAEVWAAGWSPDSNYVVSVSVDGTARVWNALTGTLLVTYRGHNNTVRTVSWSPDGGRIATGSEDLTVQVWSATNGNKLLTYRGHSSLLRTVSWSHDSTRIVSGARDATAQIWNASTGSTIFTYSSHTATVFDAQWSPDGTKIASGSTDTTVRVWQAV